MVFPTQDRIQRGAACRTPLPDGLGRYVYDKLCQHGDKVAVVYPQLGGLQLTYQQLRRQCAIVAVHLRRMEVRPGDVLALASPGGPSYAPLLAGCLVTGVVIAPFNPAFDDDETRHVLGFLRPRLLITDQPNPLYETLAPLVVNTAEVEEWFAGSSGQDAHPVMEDAPPLNSPAAIFCSSGTTGYPKGVEVSHRALLHLLAVANDQPMVSANGSFLLPSPVFWISATMILLQSISIGGKLLLMGEFNEQLFLKVLREHQVVVTLVAPYVGVRLCKMSPQPDLTPLRLIALGGSHVDPSTQLELQTKFKLMAGQAFAMTEILMGLGGAINIPVPLGSVGRPQPNMEVKVVDTHTGDALGPGKEGELWFRGPTVTRGYYNDPAATAAAIDADGWFHSGDVGYYDDEGFFYITDRIKDLIKYKGHHVASALLEAILLRHPAVLEAAVVGVPNPQTVELPRAYVVLRPGVHVSAEDLVHFVNSEVSDHKKLRGGVIFLDKMPRTATGKLCKKILREQAKDEVAEK